MKRPFFLQKMSNRCFFAVTSLFLLTSSILLAAPADKQRARQAAQGWLKINRMPMNRSISQQIVDIETLTDESGQVLCCIVNLEPEGFVVTSADDEIEPIIAFSPTGYYYGDSDSPLTTLLKKDMTSRLEAVRLKGLGKAINRRKPQKWQSFTQAGADVSAESLPSIQAAQASSVSEVWVDPFVQSEWDQGEVWDSGSGSYVNYYNYDTPNNHVTGCVATAMAQVMRYHNWPQTGIGVKSFSIEVDGAPTSRSTLGGNGSGGAYNWSQMPHSPNSPVTPDERQAIGALCHDAGVAANMSYASGGSSASLVDADEELTATFKYTNSVYTQSFTSSGDNRLWNILNANLDAQLPVILGISRTGGGHAVVADGYGYTGSTLYHHINMGWGGSDNAWYQLPTIDASYVYTAIDDAVYNIYTSGTGEIVSGRVTNLAGAPLSGVTVSAKIGTSEEKQTTTNSRGVYALTNLSPNTEYTISASKSGENFLDQSVTTGNSSDWSTPGNRSGIFFVSANTGPPTAYDMDVDATGSVLIQLQGLDDGVPDPNLFRCIITSLPSHGILSEPNVGFIESVPYELTSSISDVNYLPCPYFGGVDTFTYKANDGGTYPTGGDSNIATVTINVNNQLTTDFGVNSNTYSSSSSLLDTSAYYDSRSQIIMLQSDIGSARRLTDLAIKVRTIPARTLNNWTIRMQHTDWTYYPSTDDVTYMFLNTGWTTVYQANETISQTGWVNFHLDVPFEYNGTQNLLIDISFNNSGTTSPGGTYYIETTAGDDRLISLLSSTGSHGDPLEWDFWALGGSYYTGWIPSMKFISVPAIDPIEGDFDASCDVTFPDFAIFSQAWQTSSGDADYDPQCDLTASKGAINLQDMMLFVEQWMQVYAY